MNEYFETKKHLYFKFFNAYLQNNKMRKMWWIKLKILIWLNWKMMIRKPIRSCLEIVIPLIVLTFFIRMKAKTDNSEWHQNVYKKLYLRDDLSFLYNSRAIMAYSPNNNSFVRKLMENNYPSIEGKKNSSELEKFLMNVNKNITNQSLIRFCFGIQFEDDLPENSNYFKISLRYGEFSFEGYWKREFTYPGYSSFQFGTGSEGSPSGRIPYYTYFSFDQLMYSLSEKILKMKTGIDLPGISIRRFPFSAFTEDRFLEKMCTSFGYGLLFMSAFFYTFVNSVKTLVADKGSRVKETLEITGVTTSLHWTSNFIRIFIPNLIIALFFTILLKLKWKNGSFFENTNFSIIFIFITIFISGVLTLSFALSTFFSKWKKAIFVASFIWILGLIPHIIIRETNYDKIGTFTKYFTSLNILTALSYGFDLIAIYEIRGKGIQWENLFETTIANNISFGGILLIMCLDIFLYILITLFMDQIFPAISQKWKNRNQNECSNSKIELNLSKTFGSNDVIKDISKRVFENQITVIYGPKNSGKTTIVSMLVFKLYPTNGKVIINGFDTETQSFEAKKCIGFSPQRNILFDYLTVAEHMELFKLKESEKNDETNVEILKQLDLLDFSHERIINLSEGMKKRLSVGLAFCGHPKVVILDEPLADIDTTSMNLIIEFLQNKKKGKTIFLTTHLLDKIHLADKIAVLANGELIHFGSSNSLEKKFRLGYHLVIKNEENSNINETIQKYIPNCEIVTDGEKTSYLLPQGMLSKFSELFSEIEQNLGTEQFEVTLITLEDVLMMGNVGEIDRNFEEYDDSENIQNKPSIEHNGLVLLKSRIQSIFLKKWIWIKRTWAMNMFIIISLILFIISSLKVSDAFVSYAKYRNFTLNDYDEPITLVENSTKNRNYIKLLDGTNQKYQITNDLNETILKLTRNDFVGMKYKYIVGASFEDDEGYTGWFNNQPYHSIPLTVQLILKTHLMELAPGIDIDFINYPVPKYPNDSIKYAVTFNIIALGLFFTVLFIGNSLITFNINERMRGIKNFQYYSGMNMFVYWFTSFLMDFAMFSIPMIVIIATFVIVKPEGISTTENFISLAFILFNFGVTVIPFIYLSSYLFKNPSTGYIGMFLFSCITGFMFYMIRILFLCERNYSNFIQNLFRIIPHYSFLEAIYAMFIPKEQLELGLNEYPDFLTSYLIVLLELVAIFIINSKMYRKFFSHKKIPPIDLNIQQNEDMNELKKNPQDEIKIVFKNDVIEVHEYECVGLFGFSAFNKTAILKKLTEVGYNLNIRKRIGIIDKNIGYSPQSEVFFDHFTTREILMIFRLMKGYPKNDCIEYTNEISKYFNFTQHLDEHVEKLSVEIKKKIDLSIALIGNPSLILLNEPTKGMGSETKRFIWNRLRKFQQRTFIIFSQDLKECEALCTRLVLMERGIIIDSGTISYLREKYADGFTIISNLKIPQQNEQLNTRKIEEFMIRYFPNSQTKITQEKVYTFIRDETVISYIFSTMEKIKKILNIEYYSVKNTTLKHVFLDSNQNESERKQNEIFDLKSRWKKRYLEMI